MVRVADERSEHRPAVERLLDASFGEARWHKTCQRLRDGRDALPTLSLVALDRDELIGTVRMWPVMLGFKPALLLGPLAVEPGRRDQAIGKRLMEAAIERARHLGESRIVLVGDAAYYEKFGFEAHATLGLDMPGWVDRKRFLAKSLKPGALADLRGEVLPVAA